MTLQEILDSVLLESGMDTESTYVDNAKDGVRRLVNLANRSVSVLARWPWEELRQTHTFTLTSDTDYSLPTDFGAFIPDTMFTDSNPEPVNFPTDASDWQFLQASSGGAGSQVRARVYGGRIVVYEPNSGSVVRFEYRSKYPVENASGAAKQYFTVDTDVPRIDADLLTQDIIWRYKKLMGMDYQADLLEAKALEQTLKGQDGGAQAITPGTGEDFFGPYYNLWRPYPNT